jgi:Leucine-rich repeat (LRR) protein
MYLSGFKNAPYLMVEPDSDLKKINPDFLEDKYTVRLFGEHNEDFINEFIKIFSNTTFLDLGMQYGIKNSFVYKFTKLQGLVFPLFKDVDFVLNCELLPKTLKQLHIYVYSKKKIINIEALNTTDLQHLTISDFDEKDLTKLSSLTNLKTLSFKTAKIKSLKGIETLTNLKCISLGGVRSLTDITDISTLQNLKFLEFDICWKLQDFSPISQLKQLEVLQLMDCKNVASIKFVKELPKLRQLYTLGTTIINDFDTTPAENIPVFFGSRASKKYNAEYPEKEIKEGQKTWSSYL